VLEPTSVHTQNDKRTPVVVATGEIDMATAPMLERELAAAIETGDGPVVLDLCDVTFFDSSGLRAAIVAHRELADQGRLLALACQPDSHVRRTFSLAGVETLLSLHPSRQEALEQALR
jgi:anti-sigma B factor antagonist